MHVNFYSTMHYLTEDCPRQPPSQRSPGKRRPTLPNEQGTTKSDSRRHCSSNGEHSHRPQLTQEAIISPGPVRSCNRFMITTKLAITPQQPSPSSPTLFSNDVSLNTPKGQPTTSTELRTSWEIMWAVAGRARKGWQSGPDTWSKSYGRPLCFMAWTYEICRPPMPPLHPRSAT